MFDNNNNTNNNSTLQIIALSKFFNTFHNCLDFEKAYATVPREMAMATLRWMGVLDGNGVGRRHI